MKAWRRLSEYSCTIGGRRQPYAGITCVDGRVLQPAIMSGHRDPKESVAVCHRRWRRSDMQRLTALAIWVDACDCPVRSGCPYESVADGYPCWASADFECLV